MARSVILLNYLLKCMSDIESKVEGVLIKDHTLISDKNMQNSLEQKGFGEIIKKKFSNSLMKHSGHSSLKTKKDYIIS